MDALDAAAETSDDADGATVDADHEATDGTTSDGTTSDGTTSDGTTTDGTTATDGTTTDGTTTDGTTTDGTTTDGTTDVGPGEVDAGTDVTSDDATDATSDDATDAATGPDACVPDCAGKACGDDGCGGSCGGCDDGDSCTGDGCVEGACVHDEIPGCVCTPDCTDRDCGTDDCGGSCGTCGAGTTCVDGLCECVPSCDGSACGQADGCGATCPCDGGSCGAAIPLTGVEPIVVGDLTEAGDNLGPLCDSEVDGADRVYVYEFPDSAFGEFSIEYAGAHVYVLGDCTGTGGSCAGDRVAGHIALGFHQWTDVIYIVVDGGADDDADYFFRLYPVWDGGFFGCNEFGCYDVNRCTTDGCNDFGECVNTPLPDGTDCQDSNRCSTGRVCMGGRCQQGTPVVCDGPCLTGECNSALGCVAIEDGTDCDDGVETTGPDTCSHGVCGAPDLCADPGPCKRARLLFGGGCEILPEPAGKACNNDATPCVGACDGAGNCSDAIQQPVGSACKAPCGPGTCNAAGQCANVIEDCRVGRCGTGYCDPEEGCVADFADPDCYRAGTWCLDGTDWCRGAYCGDGWCDAEAPHNERSFWCEDCPEHCYNTECEGRYTDVLWPGAYRANISTAYGYSALKAQQTETFTHMLEDGIRWLHLVVDYCTAKAGTGPVCLCAGDDQCGTGMPLEDGLFEIREWMEANPTEVVTLQLEATAYGHDVQAAVAAAGLEGMVYREHGDSKPRFPHSLGNMVNKNARLVIFGGGYLPSDSVLLTKYPKAEEVLEPPNIIDRFGDAGASSGVCADETGAVPPPVQQPGKPGAGQRVSDPVLQQRRRSVGRCARRVPVPGSMR